MWWLLPVFPALKRLREESSSDCKVGLGDTASTRAVQKKKKSDEDELAAYNEGNSPKQNRNKATPEFPILKTLVARKGIAMPNS